MKYTRYITINKKTKNNEQTENDEQTKNDEQTENDDQTKNDEQTIKIIEYIKSNQEKLLNECNDDTLSFQLINFLCKSDTKNYIFNDIENVLLFLKNEITINDGKDEIKCKLIVDIYENLLQYHNLK